MSSASYLSTRFEVWSGRRTWYWFVADPSCNGAAVGAAANAAEAIGEACSTIQEMVARRSGLAALSLTGQASAWVEPRNGIQPNRQPSARMSYRQIWRAISLDGAVMRLSNQDY